MGAIVLPEALKPYAWQAGQRPEGAGRPKGMPNAPKPLPPIIVQELPYPVLKLNKNETAAEYWNRQSPITLKYLLARMDAYLIYTEQGVPDPLGAQIFKLLGKEMVKAIAKQAGTSDKTKMQDVSDGATIKAWRNKLVDIKQSLSAPAKDESFMSTSEEGEFEPADDILPRIGQLGDRFEN